MAEPLNEFTIPPENPKQEDSLVFDKPEWNADTTTSEHYVSVGLTHFDSVAISNLPKYYDFLVSLKETGYEFMDFKTYISSDTEQLPEKLLVIRHDVHGRDIKWSYYAFQIEKIVIGTGRSTFFIMLNDPYEPLSVQKQYLKLIYYLDSAGMDVQPHISPVDMYINHRHPEWETYEADSLIVLFESNYIWEINDDGRQLIVLGEDVLGLNDMNNELVSLLPEYNRKWTDQTNLAVQGYASHGSSTTMNKVVNNAQVLDQYMLLNAGIFSYDSYNSKIFSVLTYLSDNYTPFWMSEPEMISPDRYQFLMHPYLWSKLR